MIKTSTYFQALIGILVVLTFTSSASAETKVNGTNFQFDDFEPMAAGQLNNILNTVTNTLPPSLTPNAGLFFHYLHRPLPGTNEQSKSRENISFVEKQMKLELGFALGISDFSEVGVTLPVIVKQDGYTDFMSMPAQIQNKIGSLAIQDLRLHAKFRFINPNREWAHGFGLGLMLTGYFPIPMSFDKNKDYNHFNSFLTKGDQSYLKSIRVEPRLILDWRHSTTGVTVATNLGFQYRPRRIFYSHITNMELRWSAGVEVPIPRVTWIRPQVSIYGAYPFLGDKDKKDFVEGLVSGTDANKKARVEKRAKELFNDVSQGRRLPIELEGGIKFALPYGLVAQVGAGGAITPYPAPGTPQYRIFGGFGYSPTGDQSDIDGDGIIDREDRCPKRYGPVDNQGCPQGDRDGDGLLDNVDKCPDQIEDFDGFQDEDGCPEPDNDGDGILDEYDQCPNAAGDEQNGGCPDLDRDRDGIQNDQDACPDQPETINDYQDEDGCPDTPPLKPSKVRLTDKKIEILDKVYFDTAKAKIQSESFELLDQVADVLNENPKITKVRVEGHTDSRGNSRKNQRLSQQRAEAVVNYLVSKGVDSKRLIAKGYGSKEPIASNKTADGREQNRRVEFTIIEVNGKKTQK